MITFYKNKGTRSDCNNHREISLLGIAGDAFACVKRVFGSSSLEIKLHTRTDDSLFNLAYLRAKRNVKNFTVRDLLFAALVAHSAQDLQTLLSQFSSACSDFGLTISLKKLKS